MNSSRANPKAHKPGFDEAIDAAFAGFSNCGGSRARNPNVRGSSAHGGLALELMERRAELAEALDGISRRAGKRAAPSGVRSEPLLMN